MLKSLLRRVGAALGLSLLLGSVPAQARAPQVAHPALWEVSDPDTTIYLFGTIHLLPDNVQWRTPKFDQAVTGSQQLVVETIVDDKNPAKLMSAMASLAFANGLPPLSQRMPPAKRPALDAAIKKSGFPPQAFDRMKTWAAAFILLGNQFRDMELKGDAGRRSGASQRISRPPASRSASSRRNVEQFELLRPAARKPRRRSFSKARSSGGKSTRRGVQRDAQRLVPWRRPGDRPDLRPRSFGFPELCSNRCSISAMPIGASGSSSASASPERSSIAVGAGHLAGKDSVLEMLKKDGYSVRRLQ